MTEPRSESLVGERISFYIEEKPQCTVEYLVEANGELVEEAHKLAIKRVRKGATLPGFRKGRAPDQLILAHYPDHVEREWDKQIANLTFVACQRVSPHRLLEQGASLRFDMKRKDRERGAEILLSFEIPPKAPSIDPRELDYERSACEEVSESDIDDLAEKTRAFFAKWEPIEDRGVEEGDYVVIDLYKKGESEEEVFKGARLLVSLEKMADWMYELVLGMHPGESREGMSLPPSSLSEEESESSPVPVRLLLERIEKQELPPMDDALAQRMGADDLIVMRERLREKLEKEREEEKKEKERESLRNHLLERFPYDIPKGLFRREIESRLKQLSQDASFQKELPKMDQKSKEEIWKNIESQSEKAIRLFYLAERVIRDHNVEISDEDIAGEMKRIRNRNKGQEAPDDRGMAISHL
ncbi:MAG: trigger factor, partial [Chlamydiota bacterium]|nr:trigger factor [Chlamydiota bacterium]